MQNVIGDLDSALHDDPIIKMQLLTLVQKNKVKGFNKALSKEVYDERVMELRKNLLEDIEGINYLISEFNYDKCIDLLNLIPVNSLTPNHFETILALFKQAKGRKRSFYDGRKPTYEDVSLILSRIESIKA